MMALKKICSCPADMAGPAPANFGIFNTEKANLTAPGRTRTCLYTAISSPNCLFLWLDAHPFLDFVTAFESFAIGNLFFDLDNFENTDIRH
jgi:hypothetical protein